MLDISPVLLLSSGIIFLLVVARLNSCLFKPLLKHMDDRAASISKDLEDAKSNGADVDGLLAQANDIIASAKKEAAAIREQAHKEAKESADAKLASAKADMEARASEFAKNLQEETMTLRQTLMSSMPQFNDSLNAKIKSI